MGFHVFHILHVLIFLPFESQMQSSPFCTFAQEILSQYVVGISAPPCPQPHATAAELQNWVKCPSVDRCWRIILWVLLTGEHYSAFKIWDQWSWRDGLGWKCFPHAWWPKFDPWNPWWKERPSSWKLFSDLPMYALIHMPPPHDK